MVSTGCMSLTAAVKDPGRLRLSWLLHVQDPDAIGNSSWWHCETDHTSCVVCYSSLKQQKQMEDPYTVRTAHFFPLFSYPS